MTAPGAPFSRDSQRSASSSHSDHIGGIVLCGGRSSRMGMPKALLPIGDEVFLQRVTRILAGVVSPILVVAAREQELPPLDPAVRIVRDEDDYLGPLAGLAAGLDALRHDCAAAYCTSCDVPLLRPEFVRAVISQLGDHDIAVPREEKFYHPLAAVYRTSLVPAIRELLTAQRLRPLFLIESVRSITIPVEALRAADPELDSLRNVNTPEDYAAVVERSVFTEVPAGISRPESAD